jgi:Alginate export
MCSHFCSRFPTRWRNRWLGALCLPFAMTGATALAQESPELPAKPVTSAQPLTEAETQFYKGKGPGRGNSYVARYEEDYAYLRDPTKSTDFFDSLKFLSIDPDSDIYLTLNGETRFRYDYTGYRNFGVATAATPAKKFGEAPTLTPAIGVSDNELYKQRYELGADLHLGPNIRFYGDLYHGQQTGHDVGPSVPGSQRDELGLVNGFGEVYGILDDAKTGLRAGRQQVYLGNNLQVRANVSTNLPSPVFDGFRAYRDWGSARVDAFAYNLVNFSNEILQDHDNAHVNLWGLYGSYDLPRLVLGDGDARISLDPFYLGWRSSPFAGAKGAGIYNDRALLTGGKIVAATGAGFIASQDHRDTFGLRAYGDAAENIDFDWQGAYQAGSYAGLTVDAFAFNTDTGYAFHDLPWRPRIGVHIDGASGGANKPGKTLSTYQPMYPDTQYYAPNNEFAPTNFYDIAPRISVAPTETIKLEYYYSFLWRYSESDAIYTGAPWPGAQGQNSYAVTTLMAGRRIGQQSDLRLTWTITPHVLTLADFGIFWPGAALRAAGGRTTTYLDANLTFKF